MNLDDLFAQPERPRETNVIIPLLMKNLVAQQESKPDTTTYRASGIGGCGRKILLKLRGHKETQNHKGVMTLSIGTMVHELLQNHLTAALDSLELKIFFSDLLSGSYDGVIKCPDGKKRLLEIKTMNVEAYQRMLLFTKIYPKYCVQSNVYMKALDAEGENIQETIFVFCNRNLAFTAEFEKEYGDQFDPVFLEVRYRRDENIIKQIGEKIDELEIHRKNETLPPYKKVSECSYCGLADVCGKIKAEEKAAEKEAKLPKPTKKKK